MSDYPFGPLSPAEFQEAVDAPFGKAVGILRKHDPLWGRSTGEAFPWRVRVVETVRMAGHVTVQAVSEEEAIKAAEALIDANKVTCDDFVDTDDVEITWVRPA